MTAKKHRLINLLIVLLTFGLSSCEKEQIDNSDNTFPLNLTATLDNRTVTLSWTEVEGVSDFEHYLVVRSTDTIPKNFDPIVNSSDVIAIIDDSKITEFKDEFFPVASELHYQVFANIKSRNLISVPAAVDFNIRILDIFNLAKTRIHPTEPLLYMYDLSSRSLHVYDYEKEEVLASQFLNLSSPPGFNIGVRNPENPSEKDYVLYLSLRTPNIFYGHDALTLENLFSITTQGEVWDMVSDDQGQIYVATDHFQKPFQVYSPDGDLVSHHNFDTDSWRVTAMLSKEKREVIEMSDDKVNFYNYNDAAGTWVSHSEFELNGNVLGEIAVSPNGKYYIGDERGFLFEKEVDYKGSLFAENFGQQYSGFAFSADSKKMYAIPKFSVGKIEVYSVPDLMKSEEISINFPVIQIHRIDSRLLVIGTANSFSNSPTVIDFIDIE